MHGTTGGERPVVFGHLGDGNLHFNFSPGDDVDLAQFKQIEEPLNRLVHDAVSAANGSISAEHGVGRNLVKQQLLRELYGDTGVDGMRAVKRALDPRGVLAPGVLFPQS